MNPMPLLSPRAALIGALALGAALADPPRQLIVYPDEVVLDGADDKQAFVVQAVYDGGVTVDVTDRAKASIDKPVARVDGHRLRPLRDGGAKLTFSFAGQRATMAVTARGAKKRREPSFRLDVIPVFMRAGCNTGACHGSARGQDGFMLSLFGYDPAGDYHRITRQLVGRRVNLAVPEQSLLLEKSIGAVNHTGGDLFTKDSEHYAVLRDWIEAGAPDDAEGTPEVESIQLLPRKFIFKEGADENTHRTVVMATYSDGSRRDVSHLAVFLTNNESTANINEHGQVTSGKYGAAYVFARFDKFTVGAEAIVLPDNADYKWPDPPRHNFIDDIVFDKLEKLQIAPSDLCRDEVFLRRVHLDLVGLPPPPELYETFLADKAVDKRDKLIDQLLERPEFADLWAMQWGELLQIAIGRQQGNSTRPVKAIHGLDRWVREQVRANRPIDAMVRDLVTGSGSNLSHPPANFYTSGENIDAKKRAENFAQQFLGTRIQCAQCHNHPFDRWTMDDYYGFTSFFEGIDYKNGADPREFYVYFRPERQSSEHPVGQRAMSPKFLGGEAPDTEGIDPRPALAEWITGNPAFAENFANRAWAHFFGRGIVHPVDDIRISNPPSNAELLEALGRKLAEYGFDMKRLVRDICRSRTYQLSSRTNASNYLDSTQFSHGAVRRLRAEILADTMAAVTGNEPQYSGAPKGMRATQLFAGGGRDTFLQTFGASRRETVCECEVLKEPTLSQALTLINGSLLDRQIRSSGVIRAMLKEERSPQQIVDHLYIRTLCREPSPSERERMLELIGEDTGEPAAYEDVFWSLLNSTEFAFNH